MGGGGGTLLGFVDLVLSEERVDGLLLVGAYRDGDVDAAHPLTAPLSRWLDQVTVRHLRLVNLPEPGLAAMVAGMLRVDPAMAVGLAVVIEPHTRGNPCETVELLNALRREGVLTATAAGWRWDEAAVRAHLGRSEVVGLLAARAAALPQESGPVVQAMACLGGRAELSLLAAATGEPAGVVDQALAPAWRRACWWPSPRLAAGRAQSSAAARCGRCCCWEKPPPRRRVHHRTAGRGQAHRQPTCRLPRQRPAIRRVPPDRRRAGSLARVATLVARAAPPEDVFAAVAAEAGRLLGVDAAVLIRYDPWEAITVVGAWTDPGRRHHGSWSAQDWETVPDPRLRNGGWRAHARGERRARPRTPEVTASRE